MAIDGFALQVFTRLFTHFFLCWTGKIRHGSCHVARYCTGAGEQGQDRATNAGRSRGDGRENFIGRLNVQNVQDVQFDFIQGGAG